MFLKPFSRKNETFFGLRSREKLSAGRPLEVEYKKMKSYNLLYIKAEFKLSSIKKKFRSLKA